MTTSYPVDATTRPCCQGIGNHAQDCDGLEGTTMTTTERTDRRDLRIWQIKDITSRVKPEDLTDAELAAAIAILGLAEARPPGNRPIMRVQLDTTDLDLPR
jgi:hypothetical protein